ncbi:MAG: hypothetical protein NDJ92_04565 [Thermoanaerobaculia bacterium]|nr:hypothetical protein [Thermoanaerobaculia bacterium]
MTRRFHSNLFALALLFAFFGPAGRARAEIIDRIAAVVEGQVLTTSEIERMASANLIPLKEGETAEAYRRRVLGESIEFMLQRRDAERFGLKDVHPEDVDARIERLVPVGESREQFIARLAGIGMIEEDLRGLIRQRLQVEAYIDERFAPLIFVSLEEIEDYYQGTWSQQKRDEGRPVPPLAAVREQLRELLRAERLAAEVRRWTDQLRLRANVDIYAYQ